MTTTTMGRLLDQAMGLCDRLVDARNAERDRLAEWRYENERGGDYTRLHRIRRILFRADKREARRRSQLFPA
jgi:hypothetical protein